MLPVICRFTRPRCKPSAELSNPAVSRSLRLSARRPWAILLLYAFKQLQACERPMKGDDRGHALETILQRLCLVVEQVKCCVIVTEEGLPVASYPVDGGGNSPGQMIESGSARNRRKGHRNVPLAENCKPSRRLSDAVYINSTELAALSASLTGAGERTMYRLAQGKPGRLVLEGEAGTMLSFPVGEVSLALLVDSDANLAQVLFAAQKAAEEIESVLSRV